MKVNIHNNWLSWAKNLTSSEAIAPVLWLVLPMSTRVNTSPLTIIAIVARSRACPTDSSWWWTALATYKLWKLFCIIFVLNVQVWTWASAVSWASAYPPPFSDTVWVEAQCAVVTNFLPQVLNWTLRDFLLQQKTRTLYDKTYPDELVGLSLGSGLKNTVFNASRTWRNITIIL